MRCPISKRFTETTKWEDKYFRKLSPEAKLLYWYMWDRCDIAGFWEVDLHLAAFCIGYDESRLQEAFKELSSRYILDTKVVWIKSFLKHQKNDKLNENNPAHFGIIRKIAEHKALREQVLKSLDKESLLELIDDITARGYQAPSKGL